MTAFVPRMSLTTNEEYVVLKTLSTEVPLPKRVA